ncbi:MAG: methylated-DNA--[protein]-cysteine S-methyltransferase [Rubrivivax sp.]
MSALGHTLFDSALGTCAIAWGEHGVIAVQLPEADAPSTRVRLLRRWPALPPAPPPDEVLEAIGGICALLRGEPVDLGDLRLDMRDIAPLPRRVYEIARAIPRGQTLSYGEIAQRLGDKALARAVGQALGRNPFAPVVPCHRVLAANGQPGGFSAHGGVHTKLRMLAIEGACSGPQGDLFSVPQDEPS